MMLEQATEQAAQLNAEPSRIFCPLIGDTCKRTCVCYKPAKPDHPCGYDAKKDNSWFVLPPRCANPMLIQETREWN